MSGEAEFSLLWGKVSWHLWTWSGCGGEVSVDSTRADSDGNAPGSHCILLASRRRGRWSQLSHGSKNNLPMEVSRTADILLWERLRQSLGTAWRAGKTVLVKSHLSACEWTRKAVVSVFTLRETKLQDTNRSYGWVKTNYSNLGHTQCQKLTQNYFRSPAVAVAGKMPKGRWATASSLSFITYKWSHGCSEPQFLHW